MFPENPQLTWDDIIQMTMELAQKTSRVLESYQRKVDALEAERAAVVQDLRDQQDVLAAFDKRLGQTESRLEKLEKTP